MQRTRALIAGLAFLSLAAKSASDKVYIFSPDQPGARPTVVQPAAESKGKVPTVPLISVPSKGPAPSRPVILDKATPKD